MQTDDELLKIIDKLKNSEDKEARELFYTISESTLTFDVIEKFLQYLDEISDYRTKISFLEYLLKYHNDPEIYCMLGHTYKKISNYENAKFYYDKAISLDPNNFIYYYNKGILLYEEGDYSQALACFTESSLCNKNVDLVFYNLGNTYTKLNDFINAIKSYKMAIELNNKFSEAYFNLGVTYEHIKLPAEALKCYEQASLIEPGNPSYGWNKSLMLLYLQRYNEGFIEYENRLKKRNYKYHLKGKRYKGEDLNDKTLLIYTEQGFGDALLFIRLLPLLRKFNVKIILFTHNRLIRLFEANNFADEYYDLNGLLDTKIKYDYFASLLSLPAILNISPFNYCNNCSYIELKNDSEFQINFDDSKLNIGIVWKGNPEPKANRIRHTELKNFNRISNISNIKLYSFQLDAKDEITNCGFQLTDMSEHINDFYDTAKYLQKMDLIVTIDTAILHLAGSMGKKTIALIPNRLDWRWNERDEYSLLYPNVKIIRQSVDYEWDSAFDELETEILDIFNNNQKKEVDLVENLETLEENATKYFNAGKYQEAIELFNELIIKFPNDKRIINNRGLAYQKSGMYDNAICDYKKAIELDDVYTTARTNLVALLLELDDFSECEKELTSLIEKSGYNKETLFLSAFFFHKTHKYDEAEKIYLKLREDYEDDLTIAMNLGMLYNTIGHYVKAANIFIETSQKYPNTPELYFHLGNVYANYEEYERAINWYLKAIQLNNKYLDAYLNLGNAYFNLRRLQDALTLYNQLLGFGFIDYRIYQNIGIIYYELKKYKLAEDNFEKAFKMENKSAELFLGYAETLLMMGKYKKGWEYYRKRVYKDINLYPYINKIPEHKTFGKNSKILIAGEQGIGDNIMFGRYLIPFSKEYNFTFLIRKDLYNFFQLALRDYPIKVSMAENIINYDYVIPLLNLPELFETSEDNIPQTFYSFNLFDSKYENKKETDSTIKIGVCWKGKKIPFHNRKRHLSLKKILKLISGIDHIKAEWLNLQYELTESEKELCENYNIENSVEGNEDIIATLQVISNLDVVITVDTAIAHIAGTLGKLTYLLLCYSPDWRWGYEGDNTNWYPSIKIFRQNELDNWENVLNEVNLELKNFLHNRKNLNVNR